MEVQVYKSALTQLRKWPDAKPLPDSPEASIAEYLVPLKAR